MALRDEIEQAERAIEVAQQQLRAQRQRTQHQAASLVRAPAFTALALSLGWIFGSEIRREQRPRLRTEVTGEVEQDSRIVESGAGALGQLGSLSLLTSLITLAERLIRMSDRLGWRPFRRGESTGTADAKDSTGVEAQSSELSSSVTATERERLGTQPLPPA